MGNRRYNERKTVEIPIFKPEFVARYYSVEEIASRRGAVFDLSESDMSAIVDNRRRFKTTETLPAISVNLFSADVTQELPVIQDELT